MIMEKEKKKRREEALEQLIPMIAKERCRCACNMAHSREDHEKFSSDVVL